ncbi:MAG: hypothetical protein AAF696_10380, partial [Bacteroidota bacterium]
MKQALLCITLLILGISQLGAQCESQVDSLYFEGFEKILSDNWNLTSASEGARWEISHEGFGSFHNPGEGRWLFIDDQTEDNVGKAEFLSPEFNLSAYQEYVELSFDLNFQSFAQKGSFQVEIFNGINWIE